jgi:predicted RNase H-like HicB family nuclease
MTKDLAYYMSLNYEIRLKKYEDGWGAVYPDLSGTMGAGDTIEEAIDMLDISKELYFESYLEKGRTIPEPSPDAYVLAKK